MDMTQYQGLAYATAIYPDNQIITYPLIALIGEVGEFANIYKKVIRDDAEMDRETVARELGDVLWYLAALCTDLNFDLSSIAETNIAKLSDRADRNVIGGSGDNR